MDISDLKNLFASPCVVTMVGMSGSGKSTLAYELAGDAKVLSSDEMRELLTGDASNQKVTGAAFQLILDILKVRSQHGQSSVIDATNLSRKDRRAYYGPAIHGLPAYAVIVKADPEVCKARQFKRDRQVPEWVVDKHAERYATLHSTILSDEEKWTGVFEYDTETGEVTVLR